MIYWTDENGSRHNALPRIWQGITPFNALRATEKGWTQVEEVDPSPEAEDTTARDAAERDIVSAIVDLARRYDALREMASLEAVDIPALLALARRYGVTAADLQATETSILILARHLEAITGTTWAETWEGLKTRFSNYIQDILQGNGGENAV